MPTRTFEFCCNRLSVLKGHHKQQPLISTLQVYFYVSYYINKQGVCLHCEVACLLSKQSLLSDIHILYKETILPEATNLSNTN